MNLPPLGLDVAKLKFNACLVRAGGKLRHKVFANHPHGFAQLRDWLNQLGAPQVHACLEATGTYGDALATYLHEQAHLVSVVNRAAIKAYAQSRLSRTKTDRVDAAMIAGFCSERRPPEWYRSARQVAAFAGLVPRERQSGASVRGRVRLSKIGNSRLRRALYFPAITALRCSPFFQAWAEGLHKRGKSKMAVIGAVMRKLVHLAYGVLKTGKPFDPEWAKSA
jgi:transposase